jgi:very-short-patch-repair endonuclease
MSIFRFTKSRTMENTNDDLRSEEWKWVMRMSALESRFNDLELITDKWGYIRQIYMEMLPHIMQVSKTNVAQIINPYPVDWSKYFSPIEYMAWASIRSHYIAMYPQFPVFNHFIDFANPYLRIGLELDGKAYHDPVKDKIRDEMLFEFGWRIFRVTGSEANRAFKTIDVIQEESRYSETEEKWYDSEDIETWLMNTCDGVVYALKVVYFLNRENDPLYLKCMETLDAHKGFEFPLFHEDDEWW